MKVAFCIRGNYLSQYGGDTTQLIKTKEYLERLHGVEGEILVDPQKLDGSFDIAHIFNLSTRKCSEAFVLKAKEENIKIVFSTVYWDYAYVSIFRFMQFINYNLTPFTAKICLFISRISAAIFQYPQDISFLFRRHIKKMIKLADILLPNSLEEAEKMIYFIGKNRYEVMNKVRIIPNAADFKDTEKETNIFNTYQIPQGYILQVGRISFLKGQLQTIKALEQYPNVPIVFIGNDFNDHYAKVVRKRARKRGNVFFISEIPHDEVQLFYKHALLHILPSLRESPGLVSLEALANGCKIVVANHKFTPYKTYFDGIASVCNPLSMRDIKNSILQEMKTERNAYQNSDTIKSRFSWENAAKETYKAYCSVLGHN
jgi:glycosyltransferase involved in cell wall biosynthesis